MAWSRVSMAGEDEKTMFEIYRETDYNRSFHCILYTDLEEHARDDEIAKAAKGETVFTGFLDDTRKEEGRAAIDAIVDELNDMDEDEAGIPAEQIRSRLRGFLVAGPS